MIRINLLPADLRRGTRLSARVLAVAFVSTLAVSASVGWLSLKWFGELKAAEQRLVAKSSELADRQRKVQYVDQLEANKADYTSRVQTIQDIGKSRRVWSKFLDEMIDVVNNAGDSEKHLAWFDSVVVQGDSVRGATVQLKCMVQGDEQDRLANFHDDVAAAPFGKEVTLSDPNWTLDEDGGRVPPTSLRFDLSLQFQPTVAKPQAGAPAKAPAKK
ncbi:MAG: hypothetical protein FJ301_04525 [Planctomycetes bacterium]|nr:hypothetical protein [Planctomycetota bacterium]